MKYTIYYLEIDPGTGGIVTCRQVVARTDSEHYAKAITEYLNAVDPTNPGNRTYKYLPTEKFEMISK